VSKKVTRSFGAGLHQPTGDHFTKIYKNKMLKVF